MAAIGKRIRVYADASGCGPIAIHTPPEVIVDED